MFELSLPGLPARSIPWCKGLEVMLSFPNVQNFLELEIAPALRRNCFLQRSNRLDNLLLTPAAPYAALRRVLFSLRPPPNWGPLAQKYECTNMNMNRSSHGRFSSAFECMLYATR